MPSSREGASQFTNFQFTNLHPTVRRENPNILAKIYSSYIVQDLKVISSHG